MGITLGLAMVVGAGAAIANNKEVTEVNAATSQSLSAGSNSVAVKVNYNSAGAPSSNNGVRFGTKSNNGSASFSVPAGTTSFGFNIVGWKGTTTSSVNLTASTGTPNVNSFPITTNDAATGTISANNTVAINGSDEDIAKTFTISGVTAASTITVSSKSGDKRGIIWDAWYEAKALSSIALSGTYQTEFTVGDSFNHDGMVVTATYSDESTADVTSSATFTGYNMSSVGEQTVTVSYTEENVTKTVEYNITVNAPSVAFITTDKAETTGYTELDESIGFSYGNLNGTLGVATSNANVSAEIQNDNGTNHAEVKITFAKPGSSEVYLKDGDDTLATIAVTDITKSEVAITGLATSETVYIDNTLNLGSTITVTGVGYYENRKAVTWESDDETVATVSSTGVVTGVAEGTANITVTANEYETATATCTVTVTEVPKIISYTISGTNSKPAVDPNGFAPQGTTASWTTTYTTSGADLGQETSGNSQTFTMSGFAKETIITGIDLYMHSNASKGAGYATYQVGGNDEVALVGTSDAPKTFNQWGDNTEYTTSFKHVVIGTEYNIVVPAGSTFKIKVCATTNSLYCTGFKFNYDYSASRLDVTPTSQEVLCGEIADAEVTAVNFNTDPTLEYAITSGDSYISDVEIDSYSNHKAAILIETSATNYGTAVIRIRDAANPDTYYVDITIVVKQTAKQKIESNLTTRSSLSYQYHKNDSGEFTFSSVKIRFGGFISKALWDELNGQATIEGFGILLSTKDFLDGDPLKGYIDSYDGVDVKRFDHDIADLMPAEANEAQKTEQKVSIDDVYYVWNLVKNITEANLTLEYTSVAYIKTSKGIVFLNEVTTSVKQLANDLINEDENDEYNDTYLDGSLSYLANL